jgi:signal transduction histidine kinase
LDNLPVAAFLVSPAGDVLYSNRVAGNLPRYYVDLVLSVDDDCVTCDNRVYKISRVNVEKGCILLLNDITEEKKIEEELTEAREHMKSVLERERKFLEEVSHYFFNPLCIAKGYLDLTIANAEPSMRRKLEITKEAVSRVENVVKHIVIEGRIYE